MIIVPAVRAVALTIRHGINGDKNIIYRMRKILILLVAVHAIDNLRAQNLPNYWDDVQAIKKYDQIYRTPPHPILFIGSSSIRKWDGLQRAFGNYNVLNRGIGGAVINDIIFYLNDLVFTYEPRQIVMYVGENDMLNDKLTSDSILNQTKKLYRLIRAKLPATPIIYISFKPSPSRDVFMQKAKDANRLLKSFFAAEKNVVFVDVYSLMLKNEKSRPELFADDQLHMNTSGYLIWEKAIKQYLMKPDQK